MKKFLLLIAIVAISLSVFGCGIFQQKQLDSITFRKNNGTVSPPYHYQETILLRPDYAAKTLDMNYSKVFPYRNDETTEQDASSEAEIGNDFFVQFENISKILKSGSVKSGALETCVGGSNLSVEFVYTDGSKNLEELNMCGIKQDEASDRVVVQDFYDSLVRTVSEDVY